MKISTRSLVRNFPKVKAAARKGQIVEICDGRTGEAFLLTAKPTQTFGELARSAKGVYSGPRDLSSHEERYCENPMLGFPRGRRIRIPNALPSP